MWIETEMKENQCEKETDMKEDRMKEDQDERKSRWKETKVKVPDSRLSD